MISSPRVRQLLVERCGVHDPHIVRVEHEDERIVALYTVEALEGRAARTAFITGGEPAPEVTTCAGFVF